MANYQYRSVIVNHGAQELSISDGGAPESVDGGYFNPVAVFNELGAEGWRLTTGVHEQLPGIGAFTMHYFVRES
jgi:hypothetical protein